MAEKRKPCATFLLRIEGIKSKDTGKMKVQKIELFDSTLWGKKLGNRGARKFRMRVNGKWFNGKGKRGDMLFLDKWQVRDLLWRSIHL
jgi:hypothetical protein